MKRKPSRELTKKKPRKRGGRKWSPNKAEVGDEKDVVLSEMIADEFESAITFTGEWSEMAPAIGAPPTQKQTEWRIKGYLDAIRGITMDGLPDPKYLEWLADQVNEPVPPYPTEASLMGQLRWLRERLRELGED